MLYLGSALGGLAQPTPQGHGPKGYLTTFNHAEDVTEKVSHLFITNPKSPVCEY